MEGITHNPFRLKEIVSVAGAESLSTTLHDTLVLPPMRQDSILVLNKLVKKLTLKDRTNHSNQFPVQNYELLEAETVMLLFVFPSTLHLLIYNMYSKTAVGE